MLKEKYFNSKDIVNFIKEIVARNKDKKVYIFMDNAPIHIANRVRSYMDEQQIAYGFNCPYEP